MAKIEAVVAGLLFALGCHHPSGDSAEAPPKPEAPLAQPDRDALTKIAGLEVQILTGVTAIASSEPASKADALAALEPDVTALVAGADALADRTTAPACEAGVAAASHAVEHDFKQLLTDLRAATADLDATIGHAHGLELSLDDLAARRRACGVADPADYPHHATRT